MNSHFALLANAFYAAAAALTAPSFLVLVFYTFSRLKALLAPVSASSGALKNPDAVVLVLSVIARSIRGFANVLGFLQQFVFEAIAALALMALGVGVGLFLIGRGLHSHSSLARLIAAAVMTGVCLIGISSLTSVRGPLMGVSLFAILWGVYGIWVLWQRFPV